MRRLCAACGRHVTLRKDGKLRAHGRGCAGTPVLTVEDRRRLAAQADADAFRGTTPKPPAHDR